MEDTDAYKDKLDKLRNDIMAVIEEAKLPVKSAGLILDWDLPQEAADKMPQGVLACGGAGIPISGMMALIAQTSRFSLALTETIVNAAAAQHTATDTEQPTDDK